MEPDDVEARREVRTLEIAGAVFLGGGIAVVASLALWLVGALAGMSGPDWNSARHAVEWFAIVAGSGVAIWRLLRARRMGL